MICNQSSAKRPVYINGALCVSMAAGARRASMILGRDVQLWEIQRILSGKKHIPGLSVIRADEPVPCKNEKTIGGDDA